MIDGLGSTMVHASLFGMFPVLKHCHLEGDLDISWIVILSDPLGQFVRTALNFIFNCMVKSLWILLCCWPVSHQGNLQRRRDKNKLMNSWNVVTILSSETHRPCVECSLVFSSPLLFRSTLKVVQVDLEICREHLF